MRADWIWMQSATGGAGALTCAAVAGWPGWANVIAGPRRVSYTILQFADTGLQTPVQMETGIGNFDPVAGILTRTTVQRTWDGAAYLPREGVATQPTALAFGADATKVRISCTPTVDLMPALPYVGASVGGGDGYGSLPANVTNALVGSYQLGSGTIEYNPIYLAHRGPFSTATLRVGDGGGTYTGGTQSLTAAIYEVGADGLPGRKLIDFGAIGGAAPFAAAAFVSNTPLPVPVDLEPGWYYQAILGIYSGGTGGPPRVKGATSMWGVSPLTTRLATGGTLGIEAQVTGQSVLADPAVTAGLGLSNNGDFWLMALK